MIDWLLYATEIGICVAAAAWSADALGRIARYPVRFVWLSAAILSLAIPVGAPLLAPVSTEYVQPLDLAAFSFVQTSVLSVQQHVPTLSSTSVASLWALATILVALCFVFAFFRLRRVSRRWPATDFHGYRVRLAPGTGPMVLGVIRPEIILPRWVLNRSVDEQRLIVAHEVEHLAAGDQVLLGVACTVAALMPWNPACWFIVSRIRLAIEIDCDARVLKRGVSPRSYGSLLIDVAECSSPYLLGTTGLAGRASHLRLRILAMQSRSSTLPVMRVASAALIGIVSVLAACEARVPTASDVASMDASAAENGAARIGMADSSVVWTVNGTPSTAAAAKQIPADAIASIDIHKISGRPQIFIRTKHLEPTLLSNQGATPFIWQRKMLSGGEPLVFIDGAKANSAVMAKMDEARILKVEVLKGDEARKTYGGAGQYGVILVTTKPAGN
jgi:beta-lactamase regulating signal transducer with metallopeptidase domain